MGLDQLLKDVKVVAVLCNQYGDTGKGKFSDYFAAHWADVIARGTGGNNAGHTVVINGQERIFHLIPAGITYDKDGKVNILGNGMVIDPVVLCQELDELDAEGISYNNLMISKDAHVILPSHIAQDAGNKSQKAGGIGTTGRGIGPAYTDKIARRGITMGDLDDHDILQAKLKKLQAFYPGINIDDVISQNEPFAKRLSGMIVDTVARMHHYIRKGSKICLEGAQGLLLSIEHGTYPYVTSSDCSVNGTASGVGISARAIDLALGIVKFPFMTRVGAGPFPTELGGKQSEEYCADASHGRRYELETYGIPFFEKDGKIKYNYAHPMIVNLMNSDDPFEQGIGIRLAAGEYGATTGRPRRTGWTDAVVGNYAVGINGPMKLVLTKVDSVAGLNSFKIASGYDLDDELIDFTKDEKQLRMVEPIYHKFEGYGDIRGERSYDALPSSLKQAIQYYESMVGAQAAVVSTGPDQNETIVR